MRRKIDGEKVSCERCGSKRNLEWHHRVYVSDGGTDDPENLEVLCKRCHSREHAHRGDWAEFGRKGGYALCERYGMEYMRLMALRRWGRVSGDDLYRARVNGSGA